MVSGVLAMSMTRRSDSPERDAAARPAAGQPQDWRGNPRPAASRSGESERRVIDIANTPLTILSAFIIGCILGGVAMTIITGLAFWSFSGN
jgi:hypothetical protein